MIKSQIIIDETQGYYIIPSGVIHGDLNEQNLIVDEMNGIWNVAGVIDFGDMQKNYLVFELAIIMAYMMLECTKTEIDPLEGSAFVLEGFVTKRYVPQIELEILRVRTNSEKVLPVIIKV